MQQNIKGYSVEKMAHIILDDHRKILGGYVNDQIIKECALIEVKRILYAISVPPIENKGHLLYDSQVDYWQQVMGRIEAAY